MSEESEKPKTVQETDDASAAANEPRGNPEIDQAAVDKGVDQLERVKAY